MSGSVRVNVRGRRLSIGELATRTGVTAETIRYHEREGVVPPAARQRRPAAKLTPLQTRRKLGLLRQGYAGAQLARELGVSATTVRLVLRDRRRNERVEGAIAAAMGAPVACPFLERASR